MKWYIRQMSYFSWDAKENRKETFALSEVFHELSAATSRPERERVRRASKLE